MLTSDTDCYYTPRRLAKSVVRSLWLESPSEVLDSACGTGHLLSAAEEMFPRSRCIGIDCDGNAIATLRHTKPMWALVVGNSLRASTWEKKVAGRAIAPAEALVLNPPFSMGFTKNQKVTAWNRAIQCSLAMAHLMSSLERSSARVAVAIVPESLIYSERDSTARAVLERRYQVDVLRGLKSSTFRGARANGLIIRLEKRRVPAIPTTDECGVIGGPAGRQIEVIRGGLPVFQRNLCSGGVPYIHSTDLGILAKTRNSIGLDRVKAISRGTITGHVVLLPRVGEPKLNFVRAMTLKSDCQLSDCVIALRTACAGQAKVLEKTIRRRFEQLRDVYRGTGARYVTMKRVIAYAESLECQLRPPTSSSAPFACSHPAIYRVKSELPRSSARLGSRSPTRTQRARL